MSQPEPTNRSDRPVTPSDPVWKLPAFVFAILVVVGIVGSLVLVLVNRGDVWRGFGAAWVSVLLAQVVSIPVILLSARGDARKMVGGLMAASGVRLIVAVAGVLLAVVVGKFPPVPSLFSLVAVYLPVLAAETWMLARPSPRRSDATVGKT